jgi:hypothetical protein
MRPQMFRFKLPTSRPKWAGLLVMACVAVLPLFVMVPLLTQANLLDRPAKEVTITFTEGTNMAAAPSPDGQTIIVAIQSSLWSMPINGGDAKRLTGWLAYGITSVTSVGNVPYHTVFLKEALEAGNMVGPRLFSSGIHSYEVL